MKNLLTCTEHLGPRRGVTGAFVPQLDTPRGIYGLPSHQQRLPRSRVTYRVTARQSETRPVLIVST